MQLTLYNNSSARNVVYKHLTTIATLEGTIKEDVNLENVTLTIPYIENIASVNYAYLPAFNRYYYVSPEILTGDVVRLHMKSDALKSFWGSFRSSQCIARRSASAPDYRIPDNRILTLPQPQIVFRRTNCALTLSNSNNYVLTLTGK